MFAVTKDDLENYVQVYGLRTHDTLNGKPVCVTTTKMLINSLSCIVLIAIHR